LNWLLIPGKARADTIVYFDFEIKLNSAVRLNEQQCTRILDTVRALIKVHAMNIETVRFRSDPRRRALFIADSSRKLTVRHDWRFVILDHVGMAWRAITEYLKGHRPGAAEAGRYENLFIRKITRILHTIEMSRVGK
jgi:hypothetical protein